MTTTVSANNTVKIPDAIAQILDVKPGTDLVWQVAEDGTIVVHKRTSRAERAERLLGIGRHCLKPGEDPITELLRERLQDDIQEYGQSHPRA